MKSVLKTITLITLLSLTLNAGGTDKNALKGEHVDESKVTNSDMAIETLKLGNKRFLDGKTLKQDYLSQMIATKDGQSPYAVIVSCLDSRVPPEILFDQGLGDLFVARVAGNIENNDIIGSLEFATAAKGSKLILVLGHTSCGAVEGACSNVKLGKLTGLLSEIKPAIKTIHKLHPQMDQKSKEFSELVGPESVRQTVNDIQTKSKVIADLVKAGKVKVVGAMYDLKTGQVTFQ